MKYSKSPFSGVSSGFRFMKGLMAIALIAFSFNVFAQSPEVRQAYRFIDIEQPSKAKAALDQLAGKSSQNQYYAGLGYLMMGDKAKALESFQKGISMNEKDGLNHAGIGHIKLLEKNTVEAKMSFDKALAVSKQKDANVLKAVARGYLADTKFVVDAITLLNKAKSMNQTDPEVNMILGDAYLMQNNGGESVSSYERAAVADPKFAKAFYKVAKVYQRSKNTDMVTENLSKAIAADPEFAPAYQETAEMNYLAKNAAKAVEFQEKYLALTETNKDEAQYHLAFYYFMNRQFDKANAIFKDVATNPNAPAFALKFYGIALSEQKKDDTTKAVANEIKAVFDKYFAKVEKDKISALDYAYYGKNLLRLKQKPMDSLANESFAQGLAIDSAQVEIWQLHGDTYLKRQKFAEAIKAYKSLMTLRTTPMSQDLWSIGRAYYFNEQFMEADTAFTKLSEKQPTVTHGYLWAAKSRAQIDTTGAQGIAIPMYEKYLELAEKDPGKNKKDLIETYNYLAGYQLELKKNVNEARKYVEKILTLDPNNATAQEFMRVLKQGAQQQKGGSPGNK